MDHKREGKTDMMQSFSMSCGKNGAIQISVALLFINQSHKIFPATTYEIENEQNVDHKIKGKTDIMKTLPTQS